MADYNNIPEEMRARRQWTYHRIERDAKKPGKKPSRVPRQANGKNASSTDPSTWCDFPATIPQGLDGISYALVADEGLCCIDMDDVRNPETGDVVPWAEQLINELDSYTEVSGSGRGFHVYVWGKIPANAHPKGSKVEMYSHSKIMACTGDVHEFRIGIGEHDLTALFARVTAGEFVPPELRKSTTQAAPESGDASGDDFRMIGAVHRKMRTTSADELERAFAMEHPDRYAQRNREKKAHGGKNYFRYSIERFLMRQENAEPGTIVVEESKHVTEAESIPEFPRLPGALGLLVEGITNDIPYDHKALAALTYVGLAISPRLRLKPDHWLQTRFYACVVADASGCKSAADKEIRRALKPIMPHVNVELSMDSGPALVETLKQSSITLLAPDELAGQFEKARAGLTGRNSLFDEFLRLFEGNETGNHTKKSKGGGGKIEVLDAYLAIFAGATTRRFGEMFTGTGANASGLQSRFVLSYANKAMPRWKSDNDEAAIERARQLLASLIAPKPVRTEDAFGFSKPEPIELRFSAEAKAALMEWRKDENLDTDGRKRILDHVKRFAMLVTACSGEVEISGASMGLALQFGDYQIAVRELLLPPDASTTEQAFENAILKVFAPRQVNGVLGPVPVMSKEKATNRVNPKNRRGGFVSFNRAWDALIRAGQLVAVGKTRKGKVAFSLANVQGEHDETLPVIGAVGDVQGVSK